MLLLCFGATPGRAQNCLFLLLLLHERQIAACDAGATAAAVAVAARDAADAAAVAARDAAAADATVAARNANPAAAAQ